MKIISVWDTFSSAVCLKANICIALATPLLVTFVGPADSQEHRIAAPPIEKGETIRRERLDEGRALHSSQAHVTLSAWYDAALRKVSGAAVARPHEHDASGHELQGVIDSRDPNSLSMLIARVTWQQDLIYSTDVDGHMESHPYAAAAVEVGEAVTPHLLEWLASHRGTGVSDEQIRMLARMLVRIYGFQPREKQPLIDFVHEAIEETKQRMRPTENLVRLLHEIEGIRSILD